jgi:hypothetical protein
MSFNALNYGYKYGSKSGIDSFAVMGESVSLRALLCALLAIVGVGFLFGMQ